MSRAVLAMIHVMSGLVLWVPGCGGNTDHFVDNAGGVTHFAGGSSGSGTGGKATGGGSGGERAQGGSSGSLGVGGKLGDAGDSGFGAGGSIDSAGGAGGSAGASAGAAGTSNAIGEVTLSQAYAYSDCSPGVQGDSIIVFWTASVSGAVGHTSATLRDATLTVNGARTLVQHLSVDPPSFSLTNGAGSADQRKIGADVSPGNWVCRDFCTQATWSLELEFDVGSASASGNFDCPS